MGWHGPVGGYKSVSQAIADNFEPGSILDERGDARPGGGVGWVLLSGAAMQDGAPLIVCVLVEGGMVKLMDSTMGPYYYDAPIAWLDLVPVRDSCGGSEHGWRAEVRARAAGQPVRTVRRGSMLMESAIVVPAEGVSCDD